MKKTKLNERNTPRLSLKKESVRHIVTPAQIVQAAGGARDSPFSMVTGTEGDPLAC